VTTVATPHRGSSFADWALKAVGVGTPLTLQPLLDLGAPAFSNLTTSFCREEFNPLTPDHPDVSVSRGCE
jgi:triacylglycerol lipase